MKPDASTTSAATSTSTSSSTTTPTRALTTASPWQSISPLHQTQNRYPPKSLFTSTPPCIQKPIPEFSTSQQDPSSPPDPRIREPIQEFSMSPQDPLQKISHPVVSSGRGFTRKCTGSVSTDQTVNVANLGQHAAEPVRSPRNVRQSPLDYLRLSVLKTRAPTSLHQVQRKSPLESSRLNSAKGVSPSASPKIVPPSSSAEYSDSKETRERTNVETFAVVRDRKVRMVDGASPDKLCRSWFRNDLLEKDYMLQLETYQAVAGATRPEKKDDDQEETETENEEKEESVDNLTPEDLLKEHVMRSKRVRARSREEHLERISRYKPRLAPLLPKPDERSDGNTPSGDQPYKK